MAYEILPSEYDLLTRDVNYPELCQFVLNLLAVQGIQNGIILDLACGTGTMSYLLANSGYEMIGVDASAEMLSVAYAKRATELSESAPAAPIFLQQDMRSLDLYGTVDACICMLDSVNYITEPDDLQKVFERVRLFLNPGGLFLFDVNTPLKLQEMDGSSFCDENEDEGVFCIWRVALTDRPRTYQFLVDLFTQNQTAKAKDIWKRQSEEHYEYAYELDELDELLRKAGFIEINRYGGIDLSAPQGNEKRIYFTAKKPV